MKQEEYPFLESSTYLTVGQCLNYLRTYRQDSKFCELFKDKTNLDLHTVLNFVEPILPKLNDAAHNFFVLHYVYAIQSTTVEGFRHIYDSLAFMGILPAFDEAVQQHKEELQRLKDKADALEVGDEYISDNNDTNANPQPEESNTNVKK